MYLVLDKDTIKAEIVLPPTGKSGFPSKFPIEEMVKAILYKLKTGVQHIVSTSAVAIRTEMNILTKNFTTNATP